MNKEFTKEQLKNIRITIDTLRSKGMTDQEIYIVLERQFDDKSKIYNLITGTATEETWSKYRILNNILIVLFALFIAFWLSRMFLVIKNLSLTNTYTIVALIAFLIVTEILLLLLIGIVKRHGWLYKPLGLLFIINFFQMLLDIIGDSKVNYLIAAFALISSCIGAIISFYIAKKVFPNFSYFKSHLLSISKRRHFR